MPNSAEGKPLGATNRLATRLYDARFRPHSPTITEIMQRYSGGTSIKTAPISYNKHKWFTGWQRFAINPFAKPARDKRNGVPPAMPQLRNRERRRREILRQLRNAPERRRAGPRSACRTRSACRARGARSSCRTCRAGSAGRTRSDRRTDSSCSVSSVSRPAACGRTAAICCRSATRRAAIALRRCPAAAVRHTAAALRRSHA